jgi:hypothetical protein
VDGGEESLGRLTVLQVQIPPMIGSEHSKQSCSRIRVRQPGEVRCISHTRKSFLGVDQRYYVR